MAADRTGTGTAAHRVDNREVPLSGSVRRRRAGVLLVGATEREVQPWLRAGGHASRSAPDAGAALAALDDAVPDLLIVDREQAGQDAAAVCRALRGEPRLADVWMLAITVPGQGRRVADAVLRAGADDYLHRPFTRSELLARVHVGLRAARQRSDDWLLRALMVNLPGAIYRSAWHAGQALELVSDEIERISGYPPENFVASDRRTLMSIVHPDDRGRVTQEIARAAEDQVPFVLEYRIVRADGAERWVLDRGQLIKGAAGQLWVDGTIVDVTERREAEQAARRAEIEQARAEELRHSRARIVEAADAARRRIERDLHDGAQQRLVSLALEVRLARSRVDADPASAGPFLEHLGEELAAASSELRELARGIHPAILTDRGLAAAVAALAARAPVPVEILELPEDRLVPVTEATAYFTVAEALTNVAKYAQATHATVRLASQADALVVEVRDDGVGGARAGSGSGLSGLADRVGACDGSLSVSSPPGEGTLVRAVLPLQAAGSG
jgi:PAS domain S-box-containing protein